MDFEKIKTVWKSKANTPSATEMEEIKSTFAQSLRRRHRSFMAFLIWLFSALSLATGLVVYNLFVTHKANLEREWVLIPLLAIPWVFAIGFLRQFRQHHRTHSHYGDSIVNTLRASLDENRLARLRTKRLALIYLLSVPALMLAIGQLRQSGKMKPNEVTSMLLLFGIALAISGGMAAFHYYRKLLPQKTEIESVLRQYDSQDAQLP